MTITRIGGVLVGFGIGALYTLWGISRQLDRLAKQLEESNKQLRDIAWHTQRIPADPKDRPDYRG